MINAHYFYSQIVIIFLSWSCVYCYESVSLKFNNVTVIGKKLYTVFESKPYAAFWKIPYAMPPLGDLRFKPPKPCQEWIHNCTYNFSVTQKDCCAHELYEDCLYLSIYTPISENVTLQLPVIVWIHEDSTYHGPDFLIDEDVVVVFISHRISILGFLNTEDKFAEGNMGAKDIVMALKWIRNNIVHFNGNPNKVTVIGSDSSAILVASLLLSPAAEDLFARVIIQSGSALSPADYRNYNFEVINKLYWNLNGPFDKLNRTKLYELLTNASVSVLLTASQDLFDSTEVRDTQRLINTFGPTVETSKNGFLNKSPLDVYKRRLTNNNVEVMMGYTSLESLYKLQGFAKNKKLLNDLNYNFQYLLPFEGIKDEYGSKRYGEIKRRIMKFYFVNGTLGERSLRRYAKYVSDQVIYPLVRQAKLHAGVSCNNVYLYRFSFKGSFNIVWDSKVPNLDWSGATSGDEICYLFRCKLVNDAYNGSGVSNERRFIKKIARLLANFAKCGNPTPNQNDRILGGLQWNPLQPDKLLRGMNLGRKLKMVNVPEQKRMDFWDELRSEFFPDKVLNEEL